MQTNTEASTAAEIKRYIVKDDWKDYEVRLEVNHSILTPERAQLINDFWGGNEDRLDDCGGNVVKTVIKLFGQTAICTFLNDGGACFRPSPEWVGNHQSRALREQEGWGGEGEGGEKNGEFGWCGIRVLAADVEMPRFDEMDVQELMP